MTRKNRPWRRIPVQNSLYPGTEDEVRLSQVWEAIEARIPRTRVRTAAATVSGMVPPPEAIPEGDWRAELAKRIAAVSGFVKMLTTTIEFGATAAGAPVLAAMTDLATQLASEARWTVRNRRIHPAVVIGPWKHLVFGHPARADGSVDRAAYTFCVLEQFHRHLKRREIYAPASTRWRNPQARLLDGEAWEAVKDDALSSLGLPETPDELLATHASTLDEALRYVDLPGHSVEYPTIHALTWENAGRQSAYAVLRSRRSDHKTLPTPRDVREGHPVPILVTGRTARGVG